MSINVFLSAVIAIIMLIVYQLILKVSINEGFVPYIENESEYLSKPLLKNDELEPLGDNINFTLTTPKMNNQNLIKEGKKLLNDSNDLENDLDITLSPNPSNGKFVLNMSGTDFGTTNIQVMSVDGKLLESNTLDRSIGSFEFDLSDYESGIYLLQIQTNDSQTVKKIVIQ